MNRTIADTYSTRRARAGAWLGQSRRLARVATATIVTEVERQTATTYDRMRVTVRAVFNAIALSLVVAGTAVANTYGSVEPIPNAAVLDIAPLRDQRLAVRQAFSERVLQCGVVDRVFQMLASTRSVTTINGLNTRLSVGAGGFAGATNPSFV